MSEQRKTRIRADGTVKKSGRNFDTAEIPGITARQALRSASPKPKKFKGMKPVKSGYNKELELNNHEPVSVAVSSIIRQLLFVVIVIVLVFAAFLCREYVLNYLSNDDYLSFRMEKKYSTVVNVDGIEPEKYDESSGYGVVKMLTAWAGAPVNADSLKKATASNATTYYSGLESTLNEVLPGYEISVSKGNKNYALLTDIYDNLSTGDPVVMYIAAKTEKIKDKSNAHYVIVTGMDVSNDIVTVVDPLLGSTVNYTIDEFISASRFTDYAKSMTEKLEFTFGIYEINTCFTIAHPIEPAE